MTVTTDNPTDQVYSEKVLTEIKELLRKDKCRIEFTFAFGTKGTYVGVQLFKPPVNPRGTKWVKVGPFLTTPENTRASALQLLASLAKEEGLCATIGHDMPDKWSYATNPAGTKTCRRCGTQKFD